MENKRLGVAHPLAHRLQAGADAAQVADALVSTWQDIDAALTPIIGQRGVASLYRRSLYLTAPAHAWPADMHAGVAVAIDLEALRSTLSQQDSAAAAAAAGDLLQTFHALLSSLIGPSLTGRLLHPVLTQPSSSARAQDPSP